MDIRIVAEWDEQCGILYSKMYPLIDGIVGALGPKAYGTSISSMGLILVCRARDFKQRKRHKKDTREILYDILFDYYMIRNVPMDQKKGIIRKQMVEITEQTLSTYRFKDFDKATFLADFKQIVNSVAW